MYATPQNKSLSHFSIAGIHGLPYVQWEGAGSNHQVQGSQWGGYCTHGSVLFPTWHRPYMALYEVGNAFTGYCVFINIDQFLQQVLQQHALDIAKQYQHDRDRWLAQAQSLRMPYWDWATNSVPPPEVISLKNVNIITPDGRTTSVPNPLYQYTFNPVDQSFPSPWRSWRMTIRHPDNPNSPNATTDAQELTRYGLTFPETSFSHSFSLLLSVNFSRFRMTSPPVHTTYSRVFILGLRSAITPKVMAVALATPSKPYMTRFMASLAVRWVTLKWLVTWFALARFRAITYLFSLQDSILYSSCITAMLIACSLFGQLSTPEYGSQRAHPKPGPGLSLEIPPSMLVLVCWAPSYRPPDY